MQRQSFISNMALRQSSKMAAYFNSSFTICPGNISVYMFSSCHSFVTN